MTRRNTNGGAGGQGSDTSGRRAMLRWLEESGGLDSFDERTLSRGLDYHRQGRVTNIALRVDGAIVATVRGRRRSDYEVVVRLDGAEEVCECTCPMAWRCKHGVAVLVAARRRLEQWRGDVDSVARPASSEPTSEFATVFTKIGAPPRGPVTLQRWLDKHKANDFADAYSETIVERLLEGISGRSRLAWTMTRYQATLRQVIIDAVSGLKLPMTVRAKAQSMLREAVAVHEVNRRVAARMTWGAATEPRLAAHVKALTEHRKTLLADGAMPRPPEEHPNIAVTLSFYPASFRCVQSEVHGWRMMEQVVTVDLRADGVVTVDTTPHNVSTGVQCEAIAYVLTALTTSTSARLIRKLADEMAVPPWQRLVDDLQRGLAPQQPDDALGDPFTLGWRLSLNLERPGLSPVECREKVRGGLKLRKYKGGRRYLADELLEHAGDRPAFGAIAVMSSLGYYDSDAISATLTNALVGLAGHPRFFLKTQKDRHVALRRAPLVLATRDVGAGADGAIAKSPQDGGFEVGFEVADRWYTAKFVRKSILTTDLDEMVLLIDEHVPVAYLCDLTAPIVAAIEATARHPALLPTAAVQPFIEVAVQASSQLPLSISEGLRGPSVQADPQLRIRLSVEADGLLVSAIVRPAPELGAELPGVGLDLLFLQRDGRLVGIERDLLAEEEDAQRVWRRLKLPASADGSGVFEALLPLGGPAFDLVGSLSRADDIETEWDTERRVTIERTIVAQDVAITARKGKGWFTFGGGAALVEGGPQVPLAELLRAIRENQRYVKVDAGRWAEIDGALARKMSALAKRQGRASLLMAPVVADLEDAGVRVGGAKALMQTLKRLRGASSLKVAVPDTLNATLRDYQVDGFVWMARLAAWAPGACLADDMGLGKTLQALALLLRRAGDGPALVIAPTSVGFNWAREAARFAPTMRVMAARSGAELRALHGAGALGPQALVITSYGLAARHATLLTETPWRTLVVDEAQALKNASTQRAQAIHGIAADFVLALTGTPVENRASELWSLFRLIGPGLLGSKTEFRDAFSKPIDGGDHSARAGLATMIAPFMLRRLKKDVAKELPARTDIVREVVLTAAERARYDQIRLATLQALAGGGDDGATAQQQRFKALAALTRLRQLACHPGLLDPKWKAGSSKLAALEELLGTLGEEGHRALVFSQFTRLLGRVRERLDALKIGYCYLDGGTPAKKRQAEVDRFQAGEAGVFLLSLKAGGTGLNLTAASYVIHLDPWWNPAVEDQATDRAHRIGQVQPVTVYRFITKDTVEEGILQMHADKRELADALLAGTGSSKSVGYDAMVALISGSQGLGGEAGAAVAAAAEAVAAEPMVVEQPRPKGLPAPKPSVSKSPKSKSPKSPKSPVAKLAAAKSSVSESSVSESSRDKAAEPASVGVVVARFGEYLALEVASESLSLPSAKQYLRVGRRLIAFAAERHLMSDWDAALAAYLEAIAAGETSAPKSEPGFARTVRRRLVAALN